MVPGQFEFALLTGVLAAFVIFTPEPLVLLRNLLFLAGLTWMAWHGFEYWHSSPWLHQLADGYRSGEGVSAALEVVSNALDEALDGWKQEAGVASPRSRAWARIWAASMVVQALRWLQDDGITSDFQVGDDTHGRPQKYQVILVTKPSEQVYGPVSDHLCGKQDFPDPIPWAATTVESIPSMLASLAFRRDFALCLIPTRLWRSTKKTLAEKFENQRFWEYYGDSGGSKAATWIRTSINRINSIQEVGSTTCEGDAIALCTSYYERLQRDWEYLSIWWNDADFAVILAGLLADDKGILVCRALMLRRDELRQKEVIEPRQNTLQQGGSMATVATMGAGVLIPMTGGLAAPFLAPVIAGSLLGRVASDVAGGALKYAEMRRMKQREMSRDGVRQTFPQLRKLFE